MKLEFERVSAEKLATLLQWLFSSDNELRASDLAPQPQQLADQMQGARFLLDDRRIHPAVPRTFRPVRLVGKNAVTQKEYGLVYDVATRDGILDLDGFKVVLKIADREDVVPVRWVAETIHTDQVAAVQNFDRSRFRDAVCKILG